MKTASVAILKQQLSRYLHEVEEVVVTAHGRPVARVVSVAPGCLRIRKPAAGISALHRLKGVALSPGRTAVDFPIEDRVAR